MSKAERLETDPDRQLRDQPGGRSAGAAGENPEVVLEATCGWYWASDVLSEAGANVHLAHPLGLHWDNRRVKNDVRDANALLDMLRLDMVPEAWIIPAPGARAPARTCPSTGPKLVACCDPGSSPRSKGC